MADSTEADKQGATATEPWTVGLQDRAKSRTGSRQQSDSADIIRDGREKRQRSILASSFADGLRLYAALFKAIFASPLKATYSTAAKFWSRHA